MRLGLLGGSFNPIHNGHLLMARHAADQVQLDQVLFIPTGDPPHKQPGSLAAAADRYEMVRLAIADQPRFAVSDMEMRRTGKSYSIDTVRVLQREYGRAAELYFLIGLDAFLEFPTWREPEALLHECRFVVLSRPGHSFVSLNTLAFWPAVDAAVLRAVDSGERPRLDIVTPSSAAIICLWMPPSEISASDIRLRLRQARPLANLLPLPVESYILQHRLYQEAGDHTHI